MDRCLETYRGMQATQIASLPPSAPVPFEAAHAIALLEQGRVSDAMTMAVRLLAVEQAPPDPMRGALLEKLREKQWDRFQQEEAMRETKFLDDVAGQRHGAREESA